MLTLRDLRLLPAFQSLERGDQERVEKHWSSKVILRPLTTERLRSWGIAQAAGTLPPVGALRDLLAEVEGALGGPPPGAVDAELEEVLEHLRFLLNERARAD